MMKHAWMLFPLLSLAACGAPQDDARPVSEPEGRLETQSIRNTDAVGYGGSGIADKIDAALDANDQRKQALDEAIDSQY
ncbi:hypothetical protein JN531_014110 [Flagellatimonas centrodinii]|uniref:hypothetical protein n=1 Tax=Flagellatimonas centrodinii TaxID=2806210 RepID=UPI001FEE5E4C|nr:hypothetical protein [Flagellatimonas centrodinii]ULQ46228.1 hypothetical protein JN531_014110 [Flagellatimonas centrodinii]